MNLNGSISGSIEYHLNFSKNGNQDTAACQFATAYHVENLKDYVKSITTAINDGIPKGFYLQGEIEIELVVVSSKDVGGKLSILVAEAGGKYQKEELSKIKFKIGKSSTGAFRISVPKRRY